MHIIGMVNGMLFQVVISLSIVSKVNGSTSFEDFEDYKNSTDAIGTQITIGFVIAIVNLNLLS